MREDTVTITLTRDEAIDAQESINRRLKACFDYYDGIIPDAVQPTYDRINHLFTIFAKALYPQLFTEPTPPASSDEPGRVGE